MSKVILALATSDMQQRRFGCGRPRDRSNRSLMLMQQPQLPSKRVLLFVGDSDIEKWPPELLPQLDGASPPNVSGHSGATMQEIIPQVEAALQNLDASTESVITVVCAGENDIGNGLSLDDTLSAFQEMLNVFFADDGVGGSSIQNRKLIFLGPKIEPWLDNDPSSRKQYVRMVRAFQRACSKHERADDIQFVDCLTMFCGESAYVPGATLGGKARAEPIYFEKDQLHLSREGYQVWQQMVENHLSTLQSRENERP